MMRPLFFFAPLLLLTLSGCGPLMMAKKVSVFDRCKQNSAMMHGGMKCSATMQQMKHDRNNMSNTKNTADDS
jgi:hypothetical protein